MILAKKKLLCFFFLFISLASNAQNWEIYDSLPGNACAEAADGGFYFASFIWFYKTDINGKILWRREIGMPVDLPAPSAMVATKDGGVIIAAATAGVDSNNAASLMKLNACGEEEWSKIYDLNEYLNGIGQIDLLKGGDLLISFYMADHLNKHGTWLLRTDSLGNIKNQSFNAIQEQNVIIDKDSNIITTGRVYTADPGKPGILFIRSGIAKTNLAGRLDWLSAYSTSKNILADGVATQQALDGGYLTLAANYQTDGNLELMIIKSDSAGNPKWSKLIGDTQRFENPIDMEKISDNRYLIASYSLDKYDPQAHYTAFIKFMIIDSLGKIYKTGSYTNNHWQTTFTNMLLTSDGKYLLCGYVTDSNASGYPVNMQSLDIKINQNLELDSIITHDTLKYDYLCNTKIKTFDFLYYTGDTIPIQPPNTSGIIPVYVIGGLSVFPNPATSHITITASGLSPSSTTCAVYNIMGEKINSLILNPGPSGSLQQEIDVSGYAKGVYLIELVQGEQRFVQKVVVE